MDFYVRNDQAGLAEGNTAGASVRVSVGVSVNVLNRPARFWFFYVRNDQNGLAEGNTAGSSVGVDVDVGVKILNRPGAVLDFLCSKRP